MKNWNDRRVLMIGILAVVVVLLVGLFVLEVITPGHTIFNDTIVGILIGAVISTPLASYVTYYTAGESTSDAILP